MPVDIQGWGRLDRTANNPITTLQDGTDVGTIKFFNYYTIDTLLEVLDAGYFDAVFPELNVGDVITVYSADDQNTHTFYVTQVNTNAQPIVVIERFNFGPFPVSTNQFEDGAVTYPKIQDVAASSLLGNRFLGEFPPDNISIDNSLEFLVNFLIIPQNYLSREAGTISAAQWNNMYAAPFQLTVVPAPEGFMYVVEHLTLRQRFVSASYAAGGTVSVQYGNAVHGAGVPASASIPVASVTGIAASSILVARENTNFPTATANGASLYLSNDTAAFTTGDGTWDYTITYRVIPV